MRHYTSPMFQHRHYAAIAKLLSEIPLSEEAKASLVAGFNSLFARDNPSFDRDRFRAAARGEPVNGKDRRD